MVDPVIYARMESNFGLYYQVALFLGLIVRADGLTGWEWRPMFNLVVLTFSIST